MDPTYELISKQVLTSNQSSVTFSNIPQTYKDLYLVVSARGTRAATLDEMEMAFNNSTSNQSSRRLYGDGSSVGSNTSSTLYIGTFPGSTSTSNTFNNSEIYIVNYSASVNKSYSATTVEERNATNPVYTYLSSGLWSNTSAISSISLKAQNALFTASSSFYLYGIKNADDGGRGYFGPAMTGGDEVYTTGNGYKVHVFKNSGTLNVTAPGEVEYLVIGGGAAGGGAGSGYAGGGGGGAGGYRCSVGSENSGGGSNNEKPLLLNTGQYSVIVGAGGSGGITTSVTGSSGNNSSLFSITSNGGGGGASQITAALNGGSGGGESYTSGPPGSGTSGQGYAGGSRGGDQGGGGGGAGSLGGNALAYSSPGVGYGGNGGSGISSSITGGSVSRAGGGGGGCYNQFISGGSSSSGGGAGGASSVSGSNGTTNTGGGGGGSGQGSSTVNGNGGSGIVIIRYRI